MKTKTFYWIMTYASMSIIFFESFTNHLTASQKNNPDDKEFKIYSNILEEERILRISLPDNYEKTQDSYPVLYQLDGTMKNFSEAVDQIKNYSSLGEIPEMIVIGIDNTDRWRDMLPVNLKKYPTSGEAGQFFNFIKNEVIGFIEEKYRTNSIRILYGRSNSALFTIFAITEDAKVFNGYIASSPSFGHCKDYIFDRMDSCFKKQFESDGYLFVSNGGRDTAVRLITPIPEFIDMLKAKSPENVILRYKYYEKEGHCPSPTLTDGLISFFQHLQSITISYFSEQPPELNPRRFAPGIISVEKYSESGCIFTKDLKSIYFTRSGGDLKTPTIFYKTFGKNKLSEVLKVPIEGFGPHLYSNDNNMIISRYNELANNQIIIELYRLQNGVNGWQNAELLLEGSRASVSDNGNIYYIDRSNESDRGVIAFRSFDNGHYTAKKIVGGGVNTNSYEAHPCIAKDESFLIFDSNRPGGYGQGDLYVCFRDDSGTWSNAYNLGNKVNSEGYEAYASISPDGKYIFYSSNSDGNFDIYWADIKIISNLQ